MLGIFSLKHGKYIICCLFFVLPLLYSPFNLDPVSSPRFIAVALSLFYCSTVFIMAQRRGAFLFETSVFRLGFFLFLSLYTALAVISLIQAINVPEGIWEVAKLMAYLLTFLILFQMFRSNDDMALLIVKALILANLAMLLVLSYQFYLSLNIKGTWNGIYSNGVSISSTMGNRNLLSSACLLMIPFIYYGLGQFQGRWKKYAFLTLVYLLIVILIMQVRTTMAAAAVGLSTVALVALIKRRKTLLTLLNRSSRNKAFVILVIVAGIVVSSLMYPQLKSKVAIYLAELDKLEVELKEDQKDEGVEVRSMAVRLVLWDKTVAMIKDNPFFGVGINNWKINLLNQNAIGLPPTARSGKVHFQRPHNDYLWVCAETGTAGLVCYLGILIAFMLASLKLLRGGDNENSAVGYMAVFMISAFIVLSFFSFPKERIFHNMIFITMAALVLSKINHAKTKKLRAQSLILTRSFTYVTLITSIILLGYGIQRARAEIYAGEAIKLNASGQWSDVLQVLAKVDLDIYNIDAASTPVEYYKGIANYSLGEFDLARENFQNAYRAYPYHIPTIINLATCYELLGDHENAIDYYKRVIRISPGFSEPTLNLCAVLFNQGRIDEAYLALRTCSGFTKDFHVKRDPRFLKTLLVVLPAKIDQLLKKPLAIVTKEKLIRIKGNTAHLLELHDHARNTAVQTDELIIAYVARWGEKE